MKKINKVLKEIHLYSDRTEYLIKLLIWAVSWGGTIYVLSDAQENATLSGAYVMFGVSVLMEFGQKLKEKEEYLSRLAHTIFCLANMIVVFMGLIILMGKTPTDGYSDWMFRLTVFVLIYMLIDFLLLCIIKADIYIEPEKIEAHKSQETDAFNSKLSYGSLGNISKGDT